MSVLFMARVWAEAPFDQTKLLVLLALADHADDTGTCWPSVPTIARKARCSERWCREVLAELEGVGWLERTARPGTSTKYRITPQPQLTPEETAGVNPSSPPVRSPSSGDPAAPAPMNHQEPSVEPSLTLPGMENVFQEMAKADPLEGFAEFWALWPKKVARAPAMKIWAKAVKAADGDVSRIMAGAARERAKVDQKLIAVYFLPNPDRWLRDHRWTDHEVPAPPAPPASAFPDRHLLPTLTFDHSRPLISAQLTPDERKILTDRAVKAGRPFGAFTEMEAQEMLKNRIPK